MEKLPEELKTKWVAALRSGEYKQGRTYLKHDDKFCCLGVLCEITGAASNSCSIIDGVPHNTIPEMVQGDMYDNDVVRVLTDMNDGDNMNQASFSEIADYIEKNL